MSSKHWLNNCGASNQTYGGLFHIDGTYKITFENYVLVVFGRTDIVRKFHPIALMLTSHVQTVDYQFFKLPNG